MRIIDNKHDFYDYLQDSTDIIVFDRRNSFDLDKELICRRFSTVRFGLDSKYRYVLMQCGGSYWLMLATLAREGSGSLITGYSLEVIAYWKNFDKPLKLFEIDILEWKGLYGLSGVWDRATHSYKDVSTDVIQSHVADFRKAVDTNNYFIEEVIHNCDSSRYPLLKASGFSQCIDPVELFCAIEEYFSMRRTSAERTEPIGATNNDKIVMHGFDTKTSFRGK